MMEDLTERWELLDEVRILRARVAELEHALSFYAAPFRYHGPNQRLFSNDEWSVRAGGVYIQDVTRDNGDIAREALKIKLPTSSGEG